MFGHALQVKKELEDAGYTFTKRTEDGHWVLSDDGVVIDHSRSQGDLIRKHGLLLEVW